MEPTNNSSNIGRIAWIVVIVGAAMLVVFAIGLRAFGLWHNDWSGYSASWHISDGTCNVAVVPIVGEIVPYANAYSYDAGDGTLAPQTNPDDFAAHMRAAENDPNIHGILVRIDSGGGSPVASEIIANSIKRSPLPVVALIREIGASGAYLAASAADTIVASPFSDVGSIGITMSYVDASEKNKKEGLQYITLSSAPFKDYLSADKPPSDADRALAERDLKILHDHFVKLVAENRNLPIEDVAALADGSGMPGTLALEKHLIDSLGDQESTAAWFAPLWLANPSEVIFCNYPPFARIGG